MEDAPSLRNVDPALRAYVKLHRMNALYDCLLHGLAVVCPDDPLQWLIDKLDSLGNSVSEDTDWQTFIPADMRPRKPFPLHPYLSRIFTFEDPSMMVDPAMMECACTFFNQILKRRTIQHWLQYHVYKHEKQVLLEERFEEGRQHHNRQKQRVAFRQWQHWREERHATQGLALQLLTHAYSIASSRMVFRAWRTSTLEAKRQRDFFERLDRGEEVDDGLDGEAADDGKDPLSQKLPRPIGLKIFSWLGVQDLCRCAQVCRGWRVLAQAPTLWSRVDLHPLRHVLDNRALSALLYRIRPFMVRLNLRGCEQLNATSFVAIRNCRNLQDLNVGECTLLDDACIQQVADGCHGLLSLNVAHTNLGDGALSHLARGCSSLQYVSLAGCQQFSERGLSQLIKGCPGLVYLSLAGCTQLEAAAFGQLRHSKMQYLILDSNPTIADDHLMLLHLPKLRHLSAQGCPELTDKALAKLVANGLHSLQLYGNEGISDDLFRMPQKQWNTLRTIQLADCPHVTDSSLQCIAKCAHLSRLDLTGCERVSDKGVRALCEGACAHALRYLTLANCLQVNDLALVALSKKCKGVRTLSLAYCDKVTEHGVGILAEMDALVLVDLRGLKLSDSALGSLGGLPRLGSLCLAECKDVSDLGLHKLCQKCPTLETLTLSHCVGVTDAGIKHLAFCCRKLLNLDVSGCGLLTDLSLQYLGAVCQHLRSLQISACTLMTDKGLKNVRRGCRYLCHIEMLYLPRVSRSAAFKLFGHVDNFSHNEDQPPASFNPHLDSFEEEEVEEREA